MNMFKLLLLLLYLLDGPPSKVSYASLNIVNLFTLHTSIQTNFCPIILTDQSFGPEICYF